MDLGLFMRCEQCKKELNKEEKRTSIDENGFTHTYCAICYTNVKR